MAIDCESIDIDVRYDDAGMTIKSLRSLKAIPQLPPEINVTATILGPPTTKLGDYVTLKAGAVGQSIHVMVTSMRVTIDMSGRQLTEIECRAQPDFDLKKNQRFKFYVRLDDGVVSIVDKWTEDVAWHADYSSESSARAFVVVDELNEAAFAEHLAMVADDQCMGCPSELFAEPNGI